MKAWYETEEWDSYYTKLVEQIILKFTLVLQRLWTKSLWNNERFIQANSEWFKFELKLPTLEQKNIMGRPVKKLKVVVNDLNGIKLKQ